MKSPQNLCAILITSVYACLCVLCEAKRLMCPKKNYVSMPKLYGLLNPNI